MTLNELKYNVRRMWGKYGFREAFDNGNGMFLFKFSKVDGMKFVVENRPWLVKFRDGTLTCVLLNLSQLSYQFGSK